VPRSTGATTSCCRRRGLCAEAFRAAARADRSLRPHPRTRDAQACLGFLAFFQGDYEPARILLEESLAVQRRLGHGRAIAFSIYGLAMVAQAHGHYGVASTLCEESRAAFREVGDAWGEAMVFQGLGQTAYLLGDPGGARSFFEEGLRLCRKLGDRRNIAVLLSGLGTVAREQGDYGEAHLLLAESLAIYRRLGDAWGIPTRLANTGSSPSTRATTKRRRSSSSRHSRPAARQRTERGSPRAWNASPGSPSRKAGPHALRACSEPRPHSEKGTAPPRSSQSAPIVRSKQQPPAPSSGSTRSRPPGRKVDH
jgi:tetratricopeptide (TPR) repeat protein